MSYLTASLPWIGWLLLAAVSLVGLFLNILGLPGIWLIPLGMIIFSVSTGFDVYIGLWSILAVIALGVLAEACEFFAGAAGSKTAGGSKRAMLGALIGGLVGAIGGTIVLPVPILGTIVGSVAGSFAGAYLVESQWVGKGHGESAKVGQGAAIGRAIGIVVKTAFGIMMAGVALIAAFPLPAPTVTMPATQPAATQPANVKPTNVQPTGTPPATQPTTSPTTE